MQFNLRLEQQLRFLSCKAFSGALLLPQTLLFSQNHRSQSERGGYCKEKRLGLKSCWCIKCCITHKSFTNSPLIVPKPSRDGFVYSYLTSKYYELASDLVWSCQCRRILYSWRIQHKNVLTAFTGLHVFNCLKDQCKVLTLTRHVSVSISHNFVSNRAASDKCRLTATTQLFRKLYLFICSKTDLCWGLFCSLFSTYSFYCYSIEVTVYWFPIRTGI